MEGEHFQRIGSAALADVPFPLTPALSLGEREKTPPGEGESDAFNKCNGRRAWLPLPKGEGRGEGEQAIRSL